MKFAYADPPYLGQGRALYSDHPDCDEYDSVAGHERLISRLLSDYPDGWAYSLSSTTLADLLPLMPKECRIGAWVKPFASFKPNVNPAYAWEPVIFFGGRKIGREVDTVRDWVAASITLERGLVGAKPQEFVFWVLSFLGVTSDDTVADLFPGSGAVGQAIESYQRQMRLFGNEERIVRG